MKATRDDPLADARLIRTDFGWRWRLDDGRILSQREMEARELRIRAGLDPDSTDAPDPDAVDTQLGAIVMAERLERGLSQRQVASLAGISQSMVARLERGGREPSWRTFRMLAEAMGLRPVVTVREAATDQTTAPSSESSSIGGPERML